MVDDCSTDTTGDVARACGATCSGLPANTGSKAGAQTFALQFVVTELVMAVDADTTLAPDAIERLIAPLEPGPGRGVWIGLSSTGQDRLGTGPLRRVHVRVRVLQAHPGPLRQADDLLGLLLGLPDREL